MKKVKKYFLYKNNLENKVQIAEQQSIKKTSLISFIKKYKTNDINNKQGNRFDVLVNSEIYDSLETHINQYALDLGEDGWNVAVFTYNFESPDSVRNFFNQEYNQLNLKGAVLVGESPYICFQGMAGANNDIYQEFPTETFFKDLDGTWLDTLRYDSGLNQLVPGSDGIFDTHVGGEGDKETEIFLGRLWPNLQYFTTLSEIQLLQNYFDRNHTYKQGSLASKDTALIYFDDAAADCADGALQKIQQVYPNVVVINDSNETTAQDYKEVRLPYGYEFIWLTAHSLALNHKFFENNGNDWDYVRSSEIPNINPQTLFYLFNCCYACRFSDPDCIGSHYVFSSDKSLAAIGYTAIAPPPTGFFSGGFFSSLGAKETLGEALKKFDDYWINQYGELQADPAVYADVLLGDPTLKVRKVSNAIVEHEAGVGRLEYKIRPNPVRGVFYVDFVNVNNVKPTDYSDLSLKIYDVSGRLIKKHALDNSFGSSLGQVDVSDLASGVYFVRIGDNNNESKTKKVIKVK